MLILSACVDVTVARDLTAFNVACLLLTVTRCFGKTSRFIRFTLIDDRSDKFGTRIMPGLQTRITETEVEAPRQRVQAKEEAVLNVVARHGDDGSVASGQFPGFAWRLMNAGRRFDLGDSFIPKRSTITANL